MSVRDRWIGWHFLPADNHTRWHRQRVRKGSVVRWDKPLQLCRAGCHASKRAIDALRYAPGPIACLVELRGERLDASDKICAAERVCLARIDATEILHLFACWCAEQSLHAERKADREPHLSSWAALRCKRRWLTGKEMNDALAAAALAASETTSETTSEAASETTSEAAATLAAAWAAVWAASEAAALAASEAAFGDVASAAVWATSEAAALAASETAFGDAQNYKLESMLLRTMGLTRRRVAALRRGR